MNKKILLGSALALAASSAFAADFTTWFGDQGVYQIETGLDNGTGTSGYWYSYNDKNDGGASAIDWKGVSLETEFAEEAMDNVIESCGGICGIAVLSAGSLTYSPFIGIGFNVAGTATATGGEAQPADATAWGGVCIAYTAEAVPTLEMGLGDTKDAAIAYDNPAFQLSKAASAPVIKNIPWSDFTQAGWGVKNGGEAITSDEAAAILASIKFKIQAKEGSYNFNIMSVGPYNGGCAATTPPDAVKGVRAASAAKAIVSNGMLSFTGITSTASVEIINLQGQVMMKSTINASSSLDLSRLDAGIYMVRVAGKSVDFASKIVLK